MSIQRRYQASFLSGEVNQDYLRRADSELVQASCKRAKNILLNPAGGFERRPGTEKVVDIDDETWRLYRFVGDGFVEDILFKDSQMLVYSSAGTLLQTISSMNWATADLVKMQIADDDDRLFIVGNGFKSAIATRADDGTWSVADFAFADGFGQDINAPFYRIAPPGVSISVSGFTGSVTVTFSQSFLTSDFIGTRFRYQLANQIEITAVTNGTTATGLVRGTLYPNYDLTITVAEAGKFKVGQVVSGDTSLLSAQISSISGTTMNVVMLDSYEKFDEDENGVVEKLVGPEGNCVPTVQTAGASPVTTTLWDETLISDARGYPGSVTVHRSRLYFGNFPSAPSLIAASTSGALTNFSIGSEASDAIIEPLGDDLNAQVRHIVSAEQLIIMTDRGAYYVPESGENPITPSSIEFLRIGPEGSGDVQPFVASEGVLFIDGAAGRLMICVPTGNVRRSWEIVELSENAFHLLTDPCRLAMANGIDGRPERYVLVLNTDGTLAVAMYRRNDNSIGWTEWSRAVGLWEDVSTVQDEVRVISSQGSTKRVSKFSVSALIDDEESYEASATGRASLASYIVESNVVVDSGTLDGSGDLATTAAASGLTVGLDFQVEATPVPPTIEQLGFRRLRIPRYWLECLSSGSVRVAGEIHSPYQGGDDLGEVGKVRTRVLEGFTLGWADEPTLPITQEIGEGATLDVRALTYEVAF